VNQRHSLTPAERTLRAQIAAHESWAQTTDRTTRTAKARQALEEKFLAQADDDPVRAEHLRKAYFARMSLKSAQARRRRAANRQAAAQGRLAELDGGDDNAA
jgi:hypothetical protein